MRRAAILGCILLMSVATRASFACEVRLKNVSLGPGKLRQLNPSQFPAVDPPAAGRLQTAVEIEVTVAADDDPCMVGLGLGSASDPAPVSLLVERAFLTRLDPAEPRAKSIVLPWIAQSRGALLVESPDAVAGSSWTGFTGVVSPAPYPLAAGETFGVAFVLSFAAVQAGGVPGLPVQLAVGGILDNGAPDLRPGSSDPIGYSEPGALGTCVPTAITHCLEHGRFAVDGTWGDGDRSGVALTDPWPTANSGSFYFFDPALLETQVKVIDGSAVNGHCWVFASAMTHVGTTIRVTDTQTARAKTYSNPGGRLGTAVQDVEAFPCVASAP